MPIPPADIHRFLSHILLNGRGKINCPSPEAARLDLQRIYKFRRAKRKDVAQIYPADDPRRDMTEWDYITFRIVDNVILGENLPPEAYQIMTATEEEMLEALMKGRKK